MICQLILESSQKRKPFRASLSTPANPFSSYSDQATQQAVGQAGLGVLPGPDFHCPPSPLAHFRYNR